MTARVYFEGDIIKGKYGKFKIIKYVSNKEIYVEFVSTNYKTKTDSSSIKRGSIKDPYFPSVCGIGYPGEGLFSRTKSPLVYSLWKHMLRRCYDIKLHVRQPHYKYCTVVKRWHNLQNFGKDITKMPNWDKDGFELDKDLRVLGNKIYGPKYCSFVPKHVNSLLNQRYGTSRVNPIGVFNNKNRYGVRLRTEKGETFIGNFKSRLEAKAAYIKYRKRYIKRTAKTYKDRIHPEVYKSLMIFQEALDSSKKDR